MVAYAKHETTGSALALALQITGSAVCRAQQYFRSSVGMEFKVDESPVTIADKTIEREARQCIEAAFPKDGILGEEYGVSSGNQRRLWIVDPIDGTRSFISGHPAFGFLLALYVGNEAQFGIVAMPALAETYLGIAEEGATLNGKAIHVSRTTQLSKAVLYLNEADKIYAGDPEAYLRLISMGQTRRLAHDCYSHALLAAGHVDAVIDYDLKPFDYLPVAAVVEAAGGIMTDWSGEKLTMQSDGRTVTAATPELHAELLTVLRE